MKRGDSGGISTSRRLGVVVKPRRRRLLVVVEVVVLADSERQGAAAAAGIDGGMSSRVFGKRIVTADLPPRSD